jgi:hypothetical protein
MALAALILGIIGLLLCWAPGVGALLALIALIFGIVAMVKRIPRRGFALIGVITGAVGVAAGGIVSFFILSGILVHLDNARASDARFDACRIKGAAEIYRAEHPNQCPTMEDLKRGYIEPSRGVRDPWDQEYVIDCTGENPVAYSLGPDGQGGEPIRCEKSSF